MITFKTKALNIKINLQNGVYSYLCESATGKTRLCNFFKRANGEIPAYGYSLSDFMNGVDPVVNARKINAKVVAFDRADFYYKSLQENIEQLGKNCIVLLDLKELKSEIAPCFIYMDERKIDIDGCE